MKDEKLTELQLAQIEAGRAHLELWFNEAVRKKPAKINEILYNYAIDLFLLWTESYMNAAIESNWAVGIIRQRVEKLLSLAPRDTFYQKHPSRCSWKSEEAKRYFCAWVIDGVRSSPEWTNIQNKLIEIAEYQAIAGKGSQESGQEEDSATRRSRVVKPMLAEKGFSIGDWAAASKVKYDTAHAYLEATHRQRADTRRKLADGLDIPESDLPE